SLVSGRRWTLRIDSLRDGLDIHLPETGAPGALKLISRMHREDGLLDKDLSSVDLREPGRMVVSLTERAESLENLDALEAPESDEGGQTAPVPSEEADASASLEGRDA
ncbi:MAG: cell division protein FtsQ/DivIB, partial [Rhodospirillaceae bacterium]